MLIRLAWRSLKIVRVGGGSFLFVKTLICETPHDLSFCETLIIHYLQQFWLVRITKDSGERRAKSWEQCRVCHQRMRNSWARKHHVLLSLTVVIEELEVCFGLKLIVDTQEEGSRPKWKCAVKLQQQVVSGRFRPLAYRWHLNIRAFSEPGRLCFGYGGVAGCLCLRACLVAFSFAPLLVNAKHMFSILKANNDLKAFLIEPNVHAIYAYACVCLHPRDTPTRGPTPNPAPVYPSAAKTW